MDYLVLDYFIVSAISPSGRPFFPLTPPLCPITVSPHSSSSRWPVRRDGHFRHPLHGCFLLRQTDTVSCSLIGGVSADRPTNGLFINGLSVPGSRRAQRIISFGSIDFMSPRRPISIIGIKRLMDTKMDIGYINSSAEVYLQGLLQTRY